MFDCKQISLSKSKRWHVLLIEIHNGQQWVLNIEFQQQLVLETAVKQLCL